MWGKGPKQWAKENYAGSPAIRFLRFFVRTSFGIEFCGSRFPWHPPVLHEKWASLTTDINGLHPLRGSGGALPGRVGRERARRGLLVRPLVTGDLRT